MPQKPLLIGSKPTRVDNNSKLHGFMGSGNMTFKVELSVLMPPSHIRD
jgi:hypothetical protein